MANERYAVPFQAFITNGVVITSDVTGRVAVAGNTTLTLSTTGGAGTFTITLGSGCTGTITSGTATITDSPKALVAGANTVTSNGAGNCTLNLTLGTAANWNTVNTWSAADGGVSGASVPTSSNDALFNANSFTAASQVLTVDASAYCLSMDWTGATNTPTLAGSSALNIYASLKFISDMGLTFTGALRFYGTSNVTTAGKTILGVFLTYDGAPNITLQDNLTSSGEYISNSIGIFNTNGKTVSCGIFYHSGSSAKTTTFGSSIVNCTRFEVGGATPTATANTATINISGTGASALGSANWNGASFNLTSTAHTVSGSPTGIKDFTCDNSAASAQEVTYTGTPTLTGKLSYIGHDASNKCIVISTEPRTMKCQSFAGSNCTVPNSIQINVTGADATAATFEGNSQTYPHVLIDGAGGFATTISGDNTRIKNLKLAGVAKTLTGTAGETYSIESLMREPTTTVMTLNSTGAAWTITGNSGYCELDYMNIANVTAGYKDIYYAGDNSTDSGGNTDIIFTRKVRPNFRGLGRW
jgi:hypothetical protein